MVIPSVLNQQLQDKEAQIQSLNTDNHELKLLCAEYSQRIQKVINSSELNEGKFVQSEIYQSLLQQTAFLVEQHNKDLFEIRKLRPFKDSYEALKKKNKEYEDQVNSDVEKLKQELDTLSKYRSSLEQKLREYQTELSRETSRSLQLESDNRRMSETSKLVEEIEKQRDKFTLNWKEEKERRDQNEKKLSEV